MKLFLLLLICPLFSIAQYEPNEKLHYRSTVITDSGTIKGYVMYTLDSTLVISPQKRYVSNSAITIPVNTIKELRIKNKQDNNLLGTFGCAVLGFTLAAGLIQNNDIDNDGKTSFFELIWGAIEGTTSKNRRRRTTALIAGGVGGTTFMLVNLFTNRKFSLVFPVNNRNGFYAEKKASLNDFIKF
jgi:hypothetical protein